jgi:hypothetical protein
MLTHLVVKTRLKWLEDVQDSTPYGEEPEAVVCQRLQSGVLAKLHDVFFKMLELNSFRQGSTLQCAHSFVEAAWLTHGVNAFEFETPLAC